jgi:hypothetical protein
MHLGERGFNRRQLRQGGGRGTGNDHLDEIVGATEFFIYQPQNSQAKGFPSLKLFLESQECEIIFTAEAPLELARYETMRVTQRKAQPIPTPALKRTHSWAHRNNYLHSFFKPMYR